MIMVGYILEVMSISIVDILERLILSIIQTQVETQYKFKISSEA